MDSMFDRTGQIVRLCEDAIPSVCSIPSDLQVRCRIAITSDKVSREITR